MMMMMMRNKYIYLTRKKIGFVVITINKGFVDFPSIDKHFIYL